MKHLAIIALIMSLIGISPAAVAAATLTDLQAQLNKAQSDLAKYQELQSKEHTKTEQYAKNITDTQKQIDSVKSTISSLQGQIGDKEKDISDTATKIDDKTKDLNDLSNKLNLSIESYYELTHLLAVEKMAGNDSISQLNNRTEYLQALQNHSIATIDAVNKARSELEASKKSLEDQKSQLAALKGEQQQKHSTLESAKRKNLASLSDSQRNEATYKEKIKKLESERAQLSQTIYALRAAQSRNGKEKFIPATSDYPWASANSNDIDPWDFFYRQCTSYAAFKWYRVFGFSFRENYEGVSGNAYNWPTIARQKGYRVSSTPKVASVVSWPAGPVIGGYGHVAWVEGVNDDGTINVSEYNWNRLSFSYRQNVRYQDYGNASFITP